MLLECSFEKLLKKAHSEWKKSPIFKNGQNMLTLEYMIYAICILHLRSIVLTISMVLEINWTIFWTT